MALVIYDAEAEAGRRSKAFRRVEANSLTLLKNRVWRAAKKRGL
jgi:hypothetical protein